MRFEVSRRHLADIMERVQSLHDRVDLAASQGSAAVTIARPVGLSSAWSGVRVSRRAP